MNPRKTSQPPNERSRLKNVRLFEDEPDSVAQSPSTLPLVKIIPNPQQPRRYFDPTALAALKESIEREGILQPLLVRPQGDMYELVAGERRYRAAEELGLTEVPVLIRELSDERATLLALTENLQREDLNPVEETEGVLLLLSVRLKLERKEVISLLHKLSSQTRGVTDNVVRNEERQTIEEVFTSVGRFSAESFRTHRLPLLKLPEEVLEALRRGEIQYTKAKEIGKVKEGESRRQLLTEAIAQSLSLTEIRAWVNNLQPVKQQEALLSRLQATYKQISKSKQMLADPKKKKKLASLLAQLEALIADG
jgi:ParB family transcriptional regulator, chromosome partitioning protein